MAKTRSVSLSTVLGLLSAFGSWRLKTFEDEYEHEDEHEDVDMRTIWRHGQGSWKSCAKRRLIQYFPGTSPRHESKT
jgi:hypothetical protein